MYTVLPIPIQNVMKSHYFYHDYQFVVVVIVAAQRMYVCEVYIMNYWYKFFLYYTITLVVGYLVAKELRYVKTIFVYDVHDRKWEYAFDTYPHTHIIIIVNRKTKISYVRIPYTSIYILSVLIAVKYCRNQNWQ